MTFFEQPSEPPRLRARTRQRSSGAGWLLAALLAGGLVAAASGPLSSLLPWSADEDRRVSEPVADDGQGVVPAIPSTVAPAWDPTPEIAALVPLMSLTDEGRALFLSTRPQLVDGENVRRLCTDAEEPADGGWHVSGCYFSPGRIAILQAGDPRLGERVVTTAVHELLHAAYDTLTARERAEVDRMLDAVVASLPADARVHASIAASVRENPSSVDTERFAYLGSELRADSSWDPALEAVYARWIADRGAVVAAHERAEAVIPNAQAALQERWMEVSGRERSEAAEAAQLDAEDAGHARAWADYEADQARFDEMPAEERDLYTVTRTYPDGRVEQLPWDQALVTRRAELEAWRGEIDARRADLGGRRAATAQLRAQAEAAAADLQALVDAAQRS